MKYIILTAMLVNSSLTFAKDKKEKARELKLQNDCQQVAKDLGCVRADGTVVRNCDRVVGLTDECKEALGL